MKSKRALIISTEFPPALGGIGSHAFYLAKELQNIGWQLVVASEQSYVSSNEIEESNKRSSFPVYRLLPTPSVLLLFRKLLFLIKIIVKHRPNIIIGTGKHGSWFAFAVSKITFRKCVLIGHGTEFTVTMSPLSEKINQYVYSSCHKLICVSNYTLQVALQKGILNANPIVIHNGGDTENFKVLEKATVAKFRLANNLVDRKTILTLGNVSDRKGQEWIIRAMPKVIATIPNAHYYCIGTPSIVPKLKEIIF